MRKYFINLILFFSFSFISCDDFICGKLEEQQKLMLENAINSKNSKCFIIENIPCENYYLNIYNKCDNIDTTKLNEIHKVLFDNNTKQGWATIHFYNSRKEFLFVHFYDGKISDKKPSW